MKLYGKKPVFERLRANPKSIQKIYLEKGTDLSEMVRLIKSAGLNFDSVDKKKFKTLIGDVHAQGVCAEVKDFSYHSLEEILRQRPALDLVCLDNLSDPQNLGAILRSLACFGGFALVLPQHRSVEVTESVLRVACGGENYVPVAKVTNLASALEKIKTQGYPVAGAVLDGENLGERELPSPLCLVVGSEGKGIRPGILPHLDLKLTIPMPEAKLSFNAALACAILAYEMRRQKKGNGGR
jgi:23S rRNA (guanosine2251-2'-O)-methyltransferase